MKKKILCFLGSVLILSSLVGCKSPVASKPKTSNKVKEFTKVGDLPSQKTKYEYLADGKTVEKDFKKDKNYTKINDLLNNFFKSLLTEDYTKDNVNYFEYRNFETSTLAKYDESKLDKEAYIKNIKDTKIQQEFSKVNLEKIMYDNYNDAYFIECRTYFHVTNNPLLSDQNKYYQQKFFVYVVKENDNWVLEKWNCYSTLRAEEKPSIYMLDVATNKSIYISKDNTSKLKEMADMKSNLESILKNYYNQDYENVKDFGKSFIDFSSSEAKANVEKLISSTLQDIKDKKTKQKLIDISYNVINYSEPTNTYYVMYYITISNPNYSDYSGPSPFAATIRMPFMATLVNQNGWKLTKLNFLVTTNMITTRTD